MRVIKIQKKSDNVDSKAQPPKYSQCIYCAMTNDIIRAPWSRVMSWGLREKISFVYGCFYRKSIQLH